MLRLEEGAAYNRIEVARAARRFPAVLDGLETGAVTLSAIRLLLDDLSAAPSCRDTLAPARLWPPVCITARPGRREASGLGT